MDKFTALRRNTLVSWSAATSVVIVALFYLSQWLNMPLYSDEIAFRLLKSRYLVDGVVDFGILACPSNVKIIPVIFRPVAYIFSVVDLEFGWSLVRQAPLAGVLLTLGATLFLVLSRGAVAASLISAVGLIGVVGSGLILSRGEVPMLFLGFACLIGFALITRRQVSEFVSGIYLIAATCLAMLAFFVHVQALILAPVLLLIVVAILVQTSKPAIRLLAILSIVSVFAGAWSTLTVKLNCPESPAIEPAIAKLELVGLARYGGVEAVQTYLWDKLPHYADQFVFKAKYDSNYLPSVDVNSSGDSLLFLNDAIQVAVLLNLLVAGLAMIVAGVLLVRILLRNEPWRDRITLSIRTAPVYLFLGLSGHLALLVYDVQNAFYRSFHVHFTLALLNCLALAGLRGKAAMILWPIGIAAISLSVGSALVSRTEMDAKFVEGWAGAFISLQTDWNMVRTNVDQVAASCKIAPGDSGIVIDDWTYDAMKRHPHLIPITYIGFAVPPKPSDLAPLYKLLRGMSATAVVTRCRSLPYYGLIPEQESNGVCCLKLPSSGAGR